MDVMQTIDAIFDQLSEQLAHANTQEERHKRITFAKRSVICVALCTAAPVFDIVTVSSENILLSS
jgi:NADH:ubiquinone oxidoreductase subunit E